MSLGNYDVMLIVVDEFSGYISVKLMKDKKTEEIILAFNLIFSEYSAYGHKIVEVHTDAESNFKNCREHII